MAFYVTTPIYYPNDEPHLGHAYTTIAADVLARWRALFGEKTFMLTGTDDHGKKIQDAAEKQGKTPLEFTDELIVTFKDAWEKLNITYDRFIRTTDEDHIAVVQHVLQKVYDAGFIYSGDYEGLYCTGCEAYYTEKDADNFCCPIHKTPLEKMHEKTYFFKMSAFQEQLLKLYEENPTFIQPDGRRNEIISRVKEGLHDLSISRSNLKWGVPLPFDKDHVAYVWFDALTNYITGVGYLEDKASFEEFWPADVHIIGKDILWFHTVIWPAMLLAADIPLPKQIFAHGWWTVNNEKMGKSAGNALKVPELISYCGVDAARYFLLRETPFGQEGDFSKENLFLRYETELANKFGNLSSRLYSLIKKYGASGDVETTFAFETVLEQTEKHMQMLSFHEAINCIFGFIDSVNEYIQTKQPWASKNPAELLTAFVGLKRASILLHCFMPETCEKVANVFGFSIDEKTLLAEAGPGDLGEQTILFPKLEQ